MSRRTYLAKLLVILLYLCKYIGRWQDQIKTSLPEEHHAKVDNVVTACVILSDVLKVLLPHGV